MKNFFSKGTTFFKRLLTSYVFLIIIPFSLSALALNYMSSKNIRENTLTYSELFVNQIASNIDSYVSELDRMTRIDMLDSTLCDYLTKNLDSPHDYYDSNKYLSTHMLKMTIQQPDIKAITYKGYNQQLFTSSSNGIKDPELVSSMLKSLNFETNDHKTYFTAAHNPTYLMNPLGESTFALIRNQYDLNNQYIGTLIMNISCEDLLNAINISPSLINDGTRIVITNVDNEIIADTKETFNYENIKSQSPIKFVPLQASKSDSSNLYISSEQKKHHLAVTAIIEKHSLFKSTRSFSTLSLIIILLLVLLLVGLSIYFSSTLVYPLKQLRQATDKFAHGNYDISIPVITNDEIGSLCNSFNVMAIRIKQLLESVFIYQIQNQEAQLKALQHQINPHFLHNTLETIRMKALVDGNRDVAKMIQQLAKLFRITLDRTSNIVSIKDELEHVKVYFDIQNMRFNNRFTLRLHIPDNLIDFPIIKLILQPLVENSINHGFSQTFDKEEIFIIATATDKGVKITVGDTGKGMNPDFLKKLDVHLSIGDATHVKEASDFSKEHKIGLLNINERLVLKYGKMAALKFEQNTPHGTIISFEIPYVASDVHIRPNK